MLPVLVAFVTGLSTPFLAEGVEPPQDGGGESRLFVFQTFFRTTFNARSFAASPNVS
jgi:hypothetical protein